MNLGVIKFVGGLVISVGVGNIVSNAIKATTPATISTFRKVCIAVGGFVLSSMIVDKATIYAEETVDKAISNFKNGKKELEDLT